MPLPRDHHFRSSKRGFTLLELAIVLGIIGLVLGAVFTAATVVRYRLLLNQASDELNLITGNVRSLYLGRNVSYAALNAATAIPAVPTAASLCAYTRAGVSQRVFPFEMVRTATHVEHPFSQADTAGCVGGSLGSVQISLVGNGDPVQFVVRYVNLTMEQCADVAIRNSTPDSGNRLQSVSINGANAGALPLDTANAAAACNGVVNTVDWFYML